jgi:hypothetical protein
LKNLGIGLLVIVGLAALAFGGWHFAKARFVAQERAHLLSCVATGFEPAEPVETPEPTEGEEAPEPAEAPDPKACDDEELKEALEQHDQGLRQEGADELADETLNWLNNGGTPPRGAFGPALEDRLQDARHEGAEAELLRLSECSIGEEVEDLTPAEILFLRGVNAECVD